MQDSAFIGMDVHKATISIAVAQEERRGDVRHWGKIPHRPDPVRKLVEVVHALAVVADLSDGRSPPFPGAGLLIWRPVAG